MVAKCTDVSKTQEVNSKLLSRFRSWMPDCIVQKLVTTVSPIPRALLKCDCGTSPIKNCGLCCLTVSPWPCFLNAHAWRLELPYVKSSYPKATTLWKPSHMERPCVDTQVHRLLVLPVGEVNEWSFRWFWLPDIIVSIWVFLARASDFVDRCQVALAVPFLNLQHTETVNLINNCYCMPLSWEWYITHEWKLEQEISPVKKNRSRYKKRHQLIRWHSKGE